MDASDLDPFAPVEDEEDFDDPFGSRGQRPHLYDVQAGKAAPDLSAYVGLDGDEDNAGGEEIDSDEAFGASEEERSKELKFLGSRSKAKNFTATTNAIGYGATETERHTVNSPDERDNAKSNEPHDGAEEESGTGSGTEVTASSSEAASNATPEPQNQRTKPSGSRDAIRALLANDTEAVASTLSASGADDVHKGRAVRRQYKTFDRLLDARMKLQKGLSTVNDLDTLCLANDTNGIINKAEAAALKLWSTLESFRCELETYSVPSDPSTKKRKALTAPLSGSSSDELVDRIESLESSAVLRRRKILDKWCAKSNKTRITTTIDSYAVAETHKIAKLSGLTKDDDSTNVSAVFPKYDDASFYQSLLRDLIAHRSTEIAMNGIANDLPPKLHLSNRQLNKKVDTRASKGRKIRYTVHEKLQNFATPEDRSDWTEAARREFFGSLLGQWRLLNEADDVLMDADEAEIDAETQALRLFRR